jgi:CelD/BcsL family acetyltransferase involved in cellulose biosynthesis
MDSKLLMPSAGIVVPAPMGRFLTALRSAIARSGRAIWRALEEQGRLRALRELEWLHAGWRFSDPERARVVRQARAFLLSQNVPHR